MTSFAPIPEPGEIPPGMVHVGWRCTSPDHDCLMPLSRVDDRPQAYPDEVYLRDANHHAGWVPVYAHAHALAQVEVDVAGDERLSWLAAQLDADERTVTSLESYERNGIESTAGGEILAYIDRAPAEVAARRRVLTLYAQLQAYADRPYDAESTPPEAIARRKVYMQAFDVVLRDFTDLLYAKRPGYRQEWGHGG